MSSFYLRETQTSPKNIHITWQNLTGKFLDICGYMWNTLIVHDSWSYNKSIKRTIFFWWSRVIHELNDNSDVTCFFGFGCWPQPSIINPSFVYNPGLPFWRTGRWWARRQLFLQATSGHDAWCLIIYPVQWFMGFHTSHAGCSISTSAPLLLGKSTKS